MNDPQPPPPPMKSIEELTHLNQHLVEHVAPLFAWPADSLVTLFSSWVAYGGQAQAAGNTAEYERALRWASDNYDQTLALALAAVPSYHSTAQAWSTAATSATASVLASEPEQVRLPTDESAAGPAGTPPKEIADETVDTRRRDPDGARRTDGIVDPYAGRGFAHQRRLPPARMMAS